MQQSNVIFGMFLIAFIVFITVRGELPEYITLLRGGGNPSKTSGGAVSGGTDPLTSTIDSLNTTAKTLTGNKNMSASDQAAALQYLYPEYMK